MILNGDPGIFEIPAVIYKGMFESEVQVTIKPNGDDIHLFAPINSVELAGEAPHGDVGVKGILKAEIVEKTSDGYLIYFPGDVQNGSNRLILRSPSSSS